jgi:hypothetical protein
MATYDGVATPAQHPNREFIISLKQGSVATDLPVISFINC